MSKPDWVSQNFTKTNMDSNPMSSGTPKHHYELGGILNVLAPVASLAGGIYAGKKLRKRQEDEANKKKSTVVKPDSTIAEGIGESIGKQTNKLSEAKSIKVDSNNQPKNLEAGISREVGALTPGKKFTAKNKQVKNLEGSGKLKIAQAKYDKNKEDTTKVKKTKVKAKENAVITNKKRKKGNVAISEFLSGKKTQPKQTTKADKKSMQAENLLTDIEVLEKKIKERNMSPDSLNAKKLIKMKEKYKSLTSPEEEKIKKTEKTSKRTNRRREALGL